MPTTRHLLSAIAISIVVFCSYLMFKLTVPYFSFDYDVDFLLTKQAILYVDIWRWSFYTHISTSLVVLFVGVFQFIRPIINQWPKTHRVLGKVYVILVLYFCAPSGLVMAFYANGGIWAKISFVLTSVLWWFFTLIAFLKIRKGSVSSHIAFMIRSYSLTLSAITLRTYVLVLPHLFILHSKEMYVLVAWLSWLPNLIVAEVLIRKKTFR
jgi:hypothetical protein